MRKYLMTWEGKPAFRWKKMSKGVVYRVTCQELGLPAAMWTQEASYQLANEWWKNKTTDHVESALQTLPTDAELDEIIARGQEARNAKILRNLANQFRDDPRQNPDDSQWIETAHAVAGRLGGLTPPDFKLSVQVDRFLALQRKRPTTADTYGELRETVRAMIGMPLAIDTREVRRGNLCGAGLKPDMDVRTITEKTVTDYYLHLQGTTYSTDRKKKVFGFFRRLVRFLWSERLIELPRNLADRQFSFGSTLKEIKTWPQEDVRECLATLSERFLLYALLAANCAMLGGDIGTLRKNQIIDGRIRRKRTKTSKHKNVPVVEYKLWPRTIALLAKYRSDHPDLALTSTTGTPLYESRFEGDDEVKKDLIGNQWRKRGFAIPLKAFRSISATLIEGHKEYGRHLEYFLGHAPSSIARRNYAAPPQALFDKLIDWLGEQYFPPDKPAAKKQGRKEN
jgi:integrase